MDRSLATNSTSWRYTHKSSSFLGLPASSVSWSRGWIKHLPIPSEGHLTAVNLLTKTPYNGYNKLRKDSALLVNRWFAANKTQVKFDQKTFFPHLHGYHLARTCTVSWPSFVWKFGIKFQQAENKQNGLDFGADFAGEDQFLQNSQVKPATTPCGSGNKKLIELVSILSFLPIIQLELLHSGPSTAFFKWRKPQKLTMPQHKVITKTQRGFEGCHDRRRCKSFNWMLQTECPKFVFKHGEAMPGDIMCVCEKW